MERSAHHLPSYRYPRIHLHHFVPTSATTAQPTIEHGKDFVGCGGAVGPPFSKPPIPTNPPSSFRPNERNDRATHHRAWKGFRRVRWSGRPTIFQATDTHESTFIISPQRAQRPRNPPSRAVRVTSADGTFRGPFGWRRLLGGWLWSLRWGFFGG